MQVLKLPSTLEDMSYSISLTGLTKLKVGRYKQRYNIPKTLVHTPLKGIIHISEYQKDFPEEFIKVQKQRHKAIKQKAHINIIKKQKAYKIDKVQVCHRIKQYVLQMKGTKQLYFWTITFPKGTTDNTAFILFNKWLTRLRSEKMLKDYLWISERQKNGTIHFHITINQRLCVQKANRFMRACIMHSINNKEINYTRIQAKNYNGVDIAKDKFTKRVVNFAKENKQKALTSYLTKYITKNDSSFQHLAWHSSRGYSNLITQIRLTEREYQKAHISMQINEDGKLESEYFLFFRWKNKIPDSFLNHFAFINNHIVNISENETTKSY